MKSFPDSPFKFLDFHIKNQIKSEWEKYKSGLIENTFYSPYDSIDEEAFMIKVYNFDLDAFDIYSFEAEVLRKLQSEIDIAEENILIGFNRRLAKKDLIKDFAEGLANQYNELIKSSKKYPFLKRHFKSLKNRIIEFYPPVSNLIKNESDTFPKNVLKLKPEFKISKIAELYEKAIELNIFDEVETPLNSFRSALVEVNSFGKIYFACSGIEMITFLDCLSHIFITFNARIIEESQIFYTKRGSLLTQSNYNKAKHQANSRSQEAKIILLRESITEILTEYI